MSFNLFSTTPPKKFFDRNKCSRIKTASIGSDTKWSQYTAPVLMDLSYITDDSTDTLQKVMLIDSMSKIECYDYLRDAYLAKFGRGANTLHHYYEILIYYGLARWNKDKTTVTYLEPLDKLPLHYYGMSDLCHLHCDDALKITVTFDEKDIEERCTYDLEGDAKQGFENLIELCSMLNKVCYPSDPKAFIMRDRITGKWRIKDDIVFDKLIEAGK